MLAGVSVEYYTRVERGNLAKVSDSVLEAIASALRLDDAERDHLYDLARAANPSPRDRPRPSARVSEATLAILDAITAAPAFVRNHRRDVVAANPLGRALYAEMYEDPVQPPNTARYLFLDPRARDFYFDWDLAANNVVAVLRSASGQYPDDTGLQALVRSLSERSGEFRTRWAAHDVRHHYAGRKHYRHPVVGDIELLFESMPLQPDTGLSLAVYPAQPGSAAERTLRLLAETVPALSRF